MIYVWGGVEMRLQCFLAFGTRQACAVRCRLCYNFPDVVDRRLGGPQNRFRYGGKDHCSCRVSNPGSPVVLFVAQLHAKCRPKLGTLYVFGASDPLFWNRLKY